MGHGASVPSAPDEPDPPYWSPDLLASKLHVLGPEYHPLIPFVLANQIGGQAMLAMHRDMQSLLLQDTGPKGVPERPSAENFVLRGSKSDWSAQLRGLVNNMRLQPGNPEVQLLGVRAVGEAVEQISMDDMLTNDACMAAAAALQNHSGDLGIQRFGCQALTSLTRGARAERRERLAAAGACEAVCGAMRAAPGDPDMAALACEAAAAMVMAWRGEGPEDASTLAPQNVLRLAQNVLRLAQRQLPLTKTRRVLSHRHYNWQAGACPSALGAMLAFPARGDMQRAAINAGACPSALGAMLAFPARGDVQRAALWCVHMLLCEPACRAANTAGLAANGGFQAVLAALRAHGGDGGVQLAGARLGGCAVLAALRVHGGDGGVQLAVALRAHGGDGGVQLAGAWVLEKLAGTGAEPCAALGQLGANEALVLMMTAASSDGTRQYAAMRALVALLANAYNTTCMAAAGAGQAVVAALSAHPQRHLCAEGCKLVERLAALPHGAGERLGAAGACDAVIAAMSRHKKDLAALEAACGALAALAAGARDTENKRRLARAGGVEAAAVTLMAHAPHAAICGACCGALAQLVVGNADNRRVAAECDAGAAVLAALRANPGDAALQAIGLNAVAGLAGASEPLCKALGESGAAEVTAAALNRHAENEVVATAAAAAVAALAKNADNKARLKKAGLGGVGGGAGAGGKGGKKGVGKMRRASTAVDVAAPDQERARMVTWAG
ncbi:armadillo-type protein [Tribonema minus]|uniref:Armadillo-type protein n=1 Tax=Tribonema minus TaxID=303371 RepID=A0A836CC58_9STRA|nr:armadillo-type protein [Tribonema minus]